MTEQQQRHAAQDFADYWKGRGYEKGESQPFWLSLLRDVLGVEHPEQFISFENQVHLDHTSFIDGFIPSTRVMIEQKSQGKNLNAPIKQSDGSLLTPFQQAKRYILDLPVSLHPLWVVTSNFEEIWVYDMERPGGEPEKIRVCDLPKEYYRLSFLVESGNSHLQREMEVSFKAGELVGKLYDALLPQYHDPESEATLHSINVLCVRLVFCLYSEDAGLFAKHDAFHDYLVLFDTAHIRKALIELFRILNQKVEERDPYLEPELASFPYVNGGLFADIDVEIPNFTDEIRDLLLNKASLDFDWSEISPTIFGAVFESTLNPETRRKGGMHYTSIENIHKVINPLFLDDLRKELDEIKADKIGKAQTKHAADFQKKLSRLKFLDPACGSGNFLTETYLSIRRLENEVLQLLNNGQVVLNVGNPIQVSINQFYGIEINDFAVTVAKTALWIAESQMIKQTENIVMTDIDFFPLTSNANIVEGNALLMDWDYIQLPKQKNPTIIAKKANIYVQGQSPATMANETFRYNEVDLYTDEVNVQPMEEMVQPINFDYIIGNPPFVGARLMSEQQKEDVVAVFGKNWKNVGNLDYVSCWYMKAARYASINNAKVALVSTNSITQGEQVANLWEPLIHDNRVHIDFAYRTFRWDSESSLKAHVHCVIIGFSCVEYAGKKLIFTESGKPTEAKNINPYLIDAPNVFIGSRKKPICDVPEIVFGSMPNDGGHFILSPQEKDELIEKDAENGRFIRLFLGADEFINNKERYCLWLVDANPSEIRRNPDIMKRVENVRNLRLASKREATKKLAYTPTLFGEIRQPESGNYLLIPRVSSEKRRYIPIGFLSPSVVTSDACLIIPNAQLFHFSVLTSNVHNAWMRTVCGRLKSDYRYSNSIVYNNFPWPNPTEDQKVKIEKTAQAILDARAKYPECSLADLYDEVTMPIELRKAHQDNDCTVMEAYGFSTKMTESECVAELMRLYGEMVNR